MAKLHRKIKAYLYDNTVTGKSGDLIARVQSDRSLGVRDICRLATTHGGSGISPEAMEYAVRLWMGEMAYNLCDGFSVNTGWFTASPSIRGAFEHDGDKFNPEKHPVFFEFHQRNRLRELLKDVTVAVPALAAGAYYVEVVTQYGNHSKTLLQTPRSSTFERVLTVA